MAELKEEDFINEGHRKDPGPMWLFILLVLLTGGGVALLQTWQSSYLDEYQTELASLQVTNREISLFLWQNPEWMRNNVRKRSGYLPAFDGSDRIGIKQGMAEATALAPPLVLYRYHTWKRLLGELCFSRPILRQELQAFIEDQPEWHPHEWSEAPQEYAALFTGDPAEDISGQLPKQLCIAFHGWRNFFQEGDSVNQVDITAGELRQFLGEYPQFQRSLWKNLFQDAGIDYLASAESLPDAAQVPRNELPPFLRAALFNWKLQRG